MAHINICLKRVFITFTALCAIAGAAIIAFALVAQFITSSHQHELEDRAFGLAVFYIIGSVSVVISVLGAYGAHKEKKVFLVLFLVTVVSGGLLMFRIAVAIVCYPPKMDAMLMERLREFKDLDTAPSDLKDMLKSLQSSTHCCGLFSHSDWGQDIPDSCLCSQQDVAMGTCTQVGSTYDIWPRKYVHSEPCINVIRHYMQLGVNIVLFFLVTLVGLAVLGTVLSSIMIHQLNRAFRQDTKAFIFTAAPPKYEELQHPVKC